MRSIYRHIIDGVEFRHLKICNKLLKAKLSKSDKDLILLIKTQLEKDWRKHLIFKLEKLIIKYENDATY